MKFVERLKDKKIVLYGLGTETEQTIHAWNGSVNIVGLLDGFRTEGEQFGYPILDVKDVVKQKDVLIVVVARPGSCKAIAKRIGDLCREYEVGLFDIRGKDLLQENRVVYDFKSAKGYLKADLVRQINETEVVSFDLFDTLVTRAVLSSDDVAELMRVRLEEKGIKISDFENRRIGAEKKLSRDNAPKLEEIYGVVLADLLDVCISPKELADMEYQIDVDLLQPRKDMVELLEMAKQKGKQIFITTESYYTASQIDAILSLNGIKNVDKVFVSCEFQVGKLLGLYDRVLESVATKNILHIGNDVVSDVEAAKRCGIKAFQIYSVSELLDLVGGLKLTSNINGLADKIKVGMFASEIFNSPFQFESEQRIHVDDAFDVGYLFCAPMMLDFAYWFGEQVENLQLKNILLCARDGYLLKKVYERIYPESKAKYLLTSRISAIRAGTNDESDIDYVNSMKFSGSVETNLKVRYGLDADSIPQCDIDATQTGLRKYTKAILDNCRKKKINNQKYIESLKLNDGSVALFDFVAKGTSQMYIQKLLDNQIIGLYFLQLEPEFMKDKGLEIVPFFKESENSAIFDNYYILEVLLTSPESSVEEFNDKGAPIYAVETRTQEDISCFMRAQEGIIKYVEKFLNLCPGTEIKVNKKIDDVFLTLVHNIEICDKDFLKLKVEDPFFNRMTDITDVL
jgi:predicted HAD superfamily hydrolase